MRKSSTIDRYGTVLRIWDCGSKVLDRYTILPPRWAKDYQERSGLWSGVGASDNPFCPQGFGMWVTAMPGNHLGKRIHWDDLPSAVQALANEAFPEFTPVGNN
jgi:hypothetical protein